VAELKSLWLAVRLSRWPSLTDPGCYNITYQSFSNIIDFSHKLTVLLSNTLALMGLEEEEVGRYSGRKGPAGIIMGKH
jgi:hypothetical protein